MYDESINRISVAHPQDEQHLDDCVRCDEAPDRDTRVHGNTVLNEQVGVGGQEEDCVCVGGGCRCVI